MFRNARSCILVTEIVNTVTTWMEQEALALEKDLGITISKDLKVSQQCKQAYSKASRM